MATGPSPGTMRPSTSSRTCLPRSPTSVVMTGTPRSCAIRGCWEPVADRVGQDQRVGLGEDRRDLPSGRVPGPEVDALGESSRRDLRAVVLHRFPEPAAHDQARCMHRQRQGADEVPGSCGRGGRVRARRRSGHGTRTSRRTSTRCPRAGSGTARVPDGTPCAPVAAGPTSPCPPSRGAPACEPVPPPPGTHRWLRLQGHGGSSVGRYPPRARCPPARVVLLRHGRAAARLLAAR